MPSFNATFLYSLDRLSAGYNACVSGLTSLLFGFKASFPVHSSGAVLVTGANSGIGLSLIPALVNQGFTVFAGLHSMADAQHLFSVIPKDAAPLLIPLHLDVTSLTTIESAHKSVKLRLLGMPLIGIVHCAGTSSIGPLEFQSKESLRRVFEVNTLGPVLVTQVFMDLLREYSGRVVLLSSISGWMSAPLNSAFASSKMALEALADSLRVELHPWNISVSLIEPGSIDTPFYTKTLTETVSLDTTLPPHGSKLYEPLIQSVTNVISDTRPLSPGYTTRSILDALFSKRPRTRYFVGWDARTAWLLRSLLPDRILDALFVTLIPDKLAPDSEAAVEFDCSHCKEKLDSEMVYKNVSLSSSVARHR